MAMAYAMPAHALDWRLERSLGASASISDNANQSATDPQNALILSVTPSFTLRSQGSRRVQATLQYGLTGVGRFGDDQSSDIYHNLNALGKAELVKDFLFVDGSARISQELISLLGSPAEAEINDSNRATVGTYTISPYIQQRLGTFANAQARYTHSGAIFESDVASNAVSNALSASLNSGTRFTDLTWGLNYSIREVNNRDKLVGDSTFERVTASAGYALNRKFRVFGSVGQEWNDFLSATETDGSSWSVGAGWAPSRRTSLEASVGERFFGTTYSATARHRTRTSNWNLSYVEDVNDISQFLGTTGTVYNYTCLDTNLPPSSDEYLKEFIAWPFSFSPEQAYPGLICPSQIPAGTGVLFDLRNGVFVSKTLRAGVSWGKGKLTYSLNAFDTRRDYQLLDSEDRSRGVTGAVNYRYAPKTNVIGSVGLTRNEVPAALSGTTDREDDLLTLSLGINHQFATDLSGALTFRHIQRDSNVADANYEENRLTASVNMRF
ncbi:MAG: TIGR03016 family PEP-CTERM system-associated outer membrane protein [Betaproteobacteria bacterium HGW-Betaproteobacteria-17]|nr:MAG: TIGR03016 family PEP-CTERM system-associated outer membrane protein [Betaproteobacteria bacterium HGW-Betaproteobacteria-17]